MKLLYPPLLDDPIMEQVRSALDFVGGTIEATRPRTLNPDTAVVQWLDAKGGHHTLDFVYGVKLGWLFARGRNPCITLPHLYPGYLEDIGQVIVAQCTPHQTYETWRYEKIRARQAELGSKQIKKEG